MTWLKFVIIKFVVVFSPHIAIWSNETEGKIASKDSKESNHWDDPNFSTLYRAWFKIYKESI